MLEKAKRTHDYLPFIEISAVMEGGELGGEYMILGKAVEEYLIPSAAGSEKAFLEVMVLKLRPEN